MVPEIREAEEAVLEWVAQAAEVRRQKHQAEAKSNPMV